MSMGFDSHSALLLLSVRLFAVLRNLARSLASACLHERLCPRQIVSLQAWFYDPA